MLNATLEPRPLYGIGTVARLTGLKPDTLRVWERRYGLGSSQKSDTGRRQYTQSDLEHLQMVSALVASGSRIGEIASSERKTLEMLLRGRGREFDRSKLPEQKARVLFVGASLCDWLDEHQGCLANIDAQLARFALADAAERGFPEIGKLDCVVVHCSTLASKNMQDIEALMQALQPGKMIVSYQYCNAHWLKEIENTSISAVEFPPDPAYLAFEISNCIAQKLTERGDADLGELVEAKPRQYNENELSAARQLTATLDCECPKHITDLIRALVNFEEYSSSCSVENWHDAAVHACIYTYTGQARWLMEKALSAVLEDRGEDYSAELGKISRVASEA